MSKSVLTTIAGVAAAPFTGGASLPIAAGINAATQIYGAKKASDTAKDALAAQTRSADQARQVQDQQFQAQQQRMSPFVAQGQQAVQSLGQLAQQRPQMPMFNAQQPGGGWNPQSLGQMGQPQMGAQTVKMQAPDGSVRDVPKDRVAEFQARGGKVVG